MTVYRIGDPRRNEWWKQSFHRQWGTFEAASNQEAWEEGQRLWSLPSGAGPQSGRILSLEKQVGFPPPVLVSGPTATAHSITDMQPTFQVWVRVAVGIHGDPWPQSDKPLSGTGVADDNCILCGQRYLDIERLRGSSP